MLTREHGKIEEQTGLSRRTLGASLALFSLYWARLNRSNSLVPQIVALSLYTRDLRLCFILSGYSKSRAIYNSKKGMLIRAGLRKV